MKKLIRESSRIGVTFGLVHIFFVLIGFNCLIGIMFAKLVGEKYPGDIPEPGFLIAYTIFMGLWAGLTALRKKSNLQNKGKIILSATAGLTAGILAGLLDCILSVLLLNNINIRGILTVLSPDFIQGTLFEMSPVLAVITTILAFGGGGALGGVLSILWALNPVQNLGKKISDGVKHLFNKIQVVTHGKNHLLWQIITLALAAILVIILPLKWGSYWNYVFGTVFLYVILGLGLNIIVGLSGQLVLGFIAFFAIGAYTMALLNAPLPHGLLWGFWPVLAISVFNAALAGFLLGLPLMRLRGDYLAIVTLGFGEIIRILLKSDILTNFTGGPLGVQDINGPSFFGHPFNSDVDFMYLIIAAMILAIYIYNCLQNSRTGRAWMAIREDETVARATGVDTTKYKLLALVIGAAFAGLAGAIFASRNQFTGPDEHALMASINVLSLIIVGGMGNIPGTILGAFALKGLPEILREFANYRLLTFGALLVAMMLMRPEGLIPSRRPKFKLPEEQASESKSPEVDHDK